MTEQNMIEPEDWDNAVQHVTALRDDYRQNTGYTRVNVWTHVAHLEFLLARYEMGERSTELYIEMAEVE